MENHIKWPDGVETIEVDGVMGEVKEYLIDGMVKVFVPEIGTTEIWTLVA